MATYSDSFSGADDPTGLGANWAFQRDSTHQSQIVSHTSQPAVKQTACLMAVKSTVYTPANDQFAESVISNLSGPTSFYSSLGPLARCAAPGTRNYYRAFAHSDNGTSSPGVYADLQSTTAGSGTSIGTYNAAAWAATDTIRLECSGTSITVKKNGTAIIGPITDSAFSSGFVGLHNYVNDATNNFSDSAISSFNSGDIAAAAAGPQQPWQRQAQMGALLAQ